VRCLLRFFLATLALAMICQAVSAMPFTTPEAKLLDSEFATSAWGGAVTRSDVPGSGVSFTFLELAGQSIGLKDNYPVDGVYGQILPSHANGDFSNFDAYALWVTNLDPDPILMSLFINTGFTGPSGTPSNDPANDTFWQSGWRELIPHERTLLCLDFDYAIPYHVEDNPLPHTQFGADGAAMAINAYDRTEVDAIGFQAFSNNNLEATVLVEPFTPVPEPATLLLTALGVGMALGLKRRRS